MRVFLSVVSHKHASLITELDCLSILAKHFVVVLKNNYEGEAQLLQRYCEQHNIHLINDAYGCGFGKNNNIVFKYCEEQFNIADDDFFITFNPDVVASPEDIQQLIDCMSNNSIPFAAISLYKNNERTIRDFSIRKFPTFTTFAKSFMGLGNNSIIKECLDVSKVDWAAGSFLAFRTDVYKKLRGFDEKFFMYCEDIDICYRANKQGYGLTYLPTISAVHLAKHQNRKIFSKHFYWHIKSALMFLLLSKAGIRTKSIL
jgi:hypothetical protein